MIKLLGFRRTLTLGILIGINVLLLAVYFLWASPQASALDQQLTGLRGEISTLQMNIQNTKSDMKILQDNLPFYETLKQKGFMQEQDRFVLSRALEDLKNKARIQGFSFSVGDIRPIENQDAAMAGKRLLHSRVEIERISALMDVNFFDLIDLIETEYPIHARINSFELSRVPTLTQDMLNRAGEGPFSMISASLVFDWLSLGEVQQPAQPGMPGAPVAPGGM